MLNKLQERNTLTSLHNARYERGRRRGRGKERERERKRERGREGGRERERERDSLAVGCRECMKV